MGINFVVSTTDFSFALSNARNTINSRLQNAYSGVQLTAKGDSLEVLSSDGSSSVRTTIRCMVLEEGTIVAPAMLIELISKLNGSETQISLDGSKSIKIENKREKGKSFKSSLAFIPGELSFPENDEDSASIIMPANALASAFSSISYALSKDESRLVLTGIGTEIDDGHVTFTACDGFRLSNIAVPAQTKLPSGSEKFAAVLAGRFASLLGRVAKSDGNAEVIIGKSRAYMKCGEVEMVCPMLSGTYIDYHRMVNSGAKDITAVVKKDELIRAIGCASTLASKDNILYLDFDGLTLRVMSRNEIGETVSEMEADTSGKEIKIALNRNYFSEIVKAISGEEVKICMGTPVSPVFVSGGEANHLSMVLPVRVAADAQSA